MGESSGAAYVGADAANSTGAIESEPICVKKQDIIASAMVQNPDNILLDPEFKKEDQNKLARYLVARLASGVSTRNRRIRRYAKIDKAISTWQRLSAADTKRQLTEERTGKAQAIPFNLPILATHLSDMVSFFSEAIAPVSNPFFSTSGDQMPSALTQKLNRDAARRSYYAQLSLTIRSLFKYNIGGMHVDWDQAGGESKKNTIAAPGNRWRTLDMFNTLWDPSIRDLACLHTKGEWAATIEMVNRLELLKRSLTGEWANLEGLLEKGYTADTKLKFYKEPTSEIGFGKDGQDGKTGDANRVDWSDFGLGMGTDLGPDTDGFELTTIYCWLIPAQFGLLTNQEKQELEQSNPPRNPEVFLELWRFELVGDYVVSANPHIKRKDWLNGESCEIPIYLSYLTQDQLGEAQRSTMELMQGFQRFANNMYNIYVNGLRKQVWGLKGVDPTMFDTSKLRDGDTVGILESKKPGQDVRTGFMDMTASAGVDQAMQAVAGTLDLKNTMFPTQQLPNQVAGIDRAIKSQVASVMQGSQRGLKATLRILDSTLLLNTRMEAFRNLKRFDSEGLIDVKDEEFAKLVGSGLESMEAERIAEALWQLLYAIIQNSEAMQTFDVTAIFSYITRVNSLNTDLASFVRQQAQGQPTTPQPGQPGTEQQPVQ